MDKSNRNNPEQRKNQFGGLGYALSIKIETTQGQPHSYTTLRVCQQQLRQTLEHVKALIVKTARLLLEALVEKDGNG